jgi:hypothetical protein
MRNKTSVPFHFLLAPDERHALRLAALKRGVPAAKLVRYAIARHIRPGRPDERQMARRRRIDALDRGHSR